MKYISKGQAPILIIFVIGMVGLLIGMSLSKSGFSESMMARGVAGSTSAFYVANSGVEDALYKIQNLDYGNPGPDTYTLIVGEGYAKIRVSGTQEERVIESEGRYKNFVRKLRVGAFNTTIKPDFARAIHAGMGGIEFDTGTEVSGRYKTGESFPVSIYSNSFVRGADNGRSGKPDCGSPASTTRINGNVYAVTDIERLGSGTGPCIDGDAYAGSLKECRIFGTAFSGTPISQAFCPYQNLCDPVLDPDICKTPEPQPLPDIGVSLIKQFLQTEGEIYPGDCVIGGVNDCSTLTPDGIRSIGYMIITGNLTTTADFYVSGPIWVQGNVNIASNQTISLAPDISDSSQIILATGKIQTSSNVTFTSTGNTFLLLASEYGNVKPNVCADPDDAAITISSNVKSILFYAINGCAYVAQPTAASEFYGAIIGEGIKFKNNSRLVYDPALQDATFFLRKKEGWQISSFTEE